MLLHLPAWPCMRLHALNSSRQHAAHAQRRRHNPIMHNPSLLQVRAPAVMRPPGGAPAPGPGPGMPPPGMPPPGFRPGEWRPKCLSLQLRCLACRNALAGLAVPECAFRGPHSNKQEGHVCDDV